MPPATRGAQRRFARQLREAALRATPDEATDLDRLDRLVRSEAISVLDAHRILRNVIHNQHQRDEQKAA